MTLIRKTYTTPLGDIAYWVNGHQADRLTLVLLPGLTADHRLFDLQVPAFAADFNLLLWDAPAHHLSRPFRLEFSLEDQARWLYGILCEEKVERPVLIGQSMGGYVSQAFMQCYPGYARGFVSIDSAPLQRRYMAAWEIWALKHTYTMYRWYPWKALIRDGARGCAATPCGRELMATMMRTYSHAEYARLAAFGYRFLAEAVERDLPYRIDCPALLLCGDKDMAGSARRYNKAWTEQTGIPLIWVPGAGHNSNTDAPEFVNAQIRSFLERLR